MFNSKSHGNVIITIRLKLRQKVGWRWATRMIHIEGKLI